MASKTLHTFVIRSFDVASTVDRRGWYFDNWCIYISRNMLVIVVETRSRCWLGGVEYLQINGATGAAAFSLGLRRSS